MIKFTKTWITELKMILNITEIKKLHWDLTKRLEEQKKKDIEFELF